MTADILCTVIDQSVTHTMEEIQQAEMEVLNNRDYSHLATNSRRKSPSSRDTTTRI